MPYCRKCGKWIETEDLYCDDCRNAEIIFGDVLPPEKPVDRGSRMDGFPKALASTIVSAAVFIIMIVCFVLSAVDGSVAFYILGIMISLGGSIVSIIFGVKSIVTFANNAKQGKLKPIATLICGIVGCAMSGIDLLYLLIFASLFI